MLAPSVAHPSSASPIAISASAASLKPQGTFSICPSISHTTSVAAESPCGFQKSTCADAPVVATTPTLATLPSFDLASPTPKLVAPPTPSTLTTLASVTTPASHSPFSAPLLSKFSSVPANTVTAPLLASPPASPSQNQSFGWVEEFGQTYGNAIIRNHCNEALYVASVGGWPLGGLRVEGQGWSTPQDQVIHTIAAKGEYVEPYRTTCAKETNLENEYCSSEDKVAGQGISLKISANSTGTGDIVQFEYALIKNPKAPSGGDMFYRLEYDFSMIDCAIPGVYADEYHINVATASATMTGAPVLSGSGTANAATHEPLRDIADLTDVSATSSDHQVKVKKCAGYQGGISVTFPNDTTGKKCPPINCDGKNKCMDIYMFDKSRKDEPSKRCEEEYKGDMVLDLCVAMGDGVKAGP